ncbi:hypothetical protein PUMCH_003729 [Australozyma saopauloensis]|uniref:Probable cytosolic iron-sulfur protein assembly protein 1 n=1 Tax=Australozyma saopauloensis TaxID=291208 RepID=A0AAX4HD87_9ASCO|nr:hypothetical protein PUMCH_003729 [[Candida] saopauloensis]
MKVIPHSISPHFFLRKPLAATLYTSLHPSDPPSTTNHSFPQPTMIELIKSIHAHTDKAWSVAPHQTLPLLASASSDKTSRIYKLSESQNFPQVATLADTHKRSVRAVSFKPQLLSLESDFIDLPALASGSFDATISIWGIEEPEEMDMIEEGTYEDEEGAVVNKEVELLTSPSNEWNLMALIEGHENEVKAVAWNWSGRYLASCSRDKTVWIWETDPETLEEFECVSVLSDHDQDIKHIVFHPLHNLLASSSYDDTIRLYNQDDDDDDWSCVAILNGHQGTVWCSAFEHPRAASAVDGRTRLVSASDDSTVRVWSSTSAVEVSKSGNTLPSSIKHGSADMEWVLDLTLPPVHKFAVYSVSWSNTSGRIASVGADGQIAVYKESADGWQVESTFQGAHGVHEINCVAWCKLASGEEILSTCGDDGHVNLWRL